MLKSERLFRTIAAGCFFLGVGVLATLDYSQIFDARPSRAPASAVCPDCSELTRIRTELLAHAGPESVLLRAKKAEIELRDAKLLRAAGAVMLGMFKDHDPSAEEVQATAEFLVDTMDRDGAGIALDALMSGLSPSLTDSALDAIGAHVKGLAAEKSRRTRAAQLYLATLAAFRGSGTGN